MQRNESASVILAFKKHWLCGSLPQIRGSLVLMWLSDPPQKDYSYPAKVDNPASSRSNYSVLIQCQGFVYNLFIICCVFGIESERVYYSDTRILVINRTNLNYIMLTRCRESREVLTLIEN